MPDSELARLQRAAGGDREALRGLLERYGEQVAGEIRSKIGRVWQASLDADDVMQVTYVEAFLNVASLLARDAAGFLAWLRRIAEHNLQDAIRELQRKKRPPPDKRVSGGVSDESCAALIELLGVDSRTPSHRAAGAEARGAVEAALTRLPPDYAAAVRMYDLEGRDIAAVADALGRSSGAVHMLRARAHDQLRAMLGPPGGFFSEP